MSRKSDLQDSPPSLPPEKAEEVLAELERVLGSSLFRASRRCRNLLRRITEKTIDGDFDSLKERALGVDVFGRPVDYDTAQDPVVRASAAEIRKKLAQYYQEAGHESEIRIGLSPGSYLVDYHFPAEKITPVVPAPDARPKHGSRTVLAIAIIASTALLLVAVSLAPSWQHSDLDDMWRPVLKSPGTVLMSVGLQAAYNPRSAEAQDEAQGVIPPRKDRAAHHPLSEEDLVLLPDRYVALDDALCLVRLASMLEKYRKPYRVRAQKSTSFADLRDTPAVLIGAFDNPWTLRTADQLRFTFRKDSELDTGMVYDSQHPGNSGWKLVKYWPNWDMPVDYAIVTRIVDATTGRPVIIAAGLTQYGTNGAGEFLSNEDYFSEAARRLPKDWQKKNLQIVLSVPVVNRIAGRPRVLATHVW
ncbi:MAG: hypothetical protein ABJC09_14725 [Terriglobia bacterium]